MCSAPMPIRQGMPDIVTAIAIATDPELIVAAIRPARTQSRNCRSEESSSARMRGRISPISNHGAADDPAGARIEHDAVCVTLTAAQIGIGTAPAFDHAGIASA